MGEWVPEVVSSVGSSRETARRCLATLLSLHQLPANLSAIDQALDEQPTIDLAGLSRAIQLIGHRARVVDSNFGGLAKLPLPVLVRRADASWALLAKATSEGVVLQAPAERRVYEESPAEFGAWFEGKVVLFAADRAAEGHFGLSWFIPVLAKYRRQVGDIFLATLMFQALALSTPIFFQVVLDKVFSHRAETTLAVMAIAILAAAVFSYALNLVRNQILAHTAAQIDVTLGANVYRHLFRLPLAFFETRQAGTIVSQVRGIETIRQFVMTSGVSSILDVAFSVVFIVLILLYSPLLSLVPIIGICAYVAISAIFTPILRRRLDATFRTGAASTAYLVETLSGAGNLKALAVEPQLQKNWESRLAQAAQNSVAARSTSSFMSNTVEFASQLVTAATLFFGARLVLAGDLTPGEFIAFNMFASRITAPILRLTQLWLELQQVGVSIDRLADILNLPTEAGGDNRPMPQRASGLVTFDKVDFQYTPNSPRVLTELSFSAKKGEVLAIVGPSGCGKSTLAKLLLRLYPVNSGRILLDDYDIRHVDPVWLRRQIAFVPQEITLLSGTVRDNIALAVPGASFERIVAAAKAAAAHGFILDLPQGYDTVIEERGSNLSGGQRQRIGLARALLASPPVLVLDEPTSMLDTDTARRLLDRLFAASTERTTIIITHDPITAARAHRRLELSEPGTRTERQDRAPSLALSE